jgi:enoyl-CoA hydratase/carnithine racemase
MTSADVEPSITVTEDEQVRIVTLNRPDARNAFDEAMHHQFARTMAALDDERDARAIVLTGAGRAFSAGGSLDDFEAKRVDFAQRRQSLRDARRLVDEMLNMHLPVVAAVNGPAVGLGCTLVTLCDIVFMAESAFLSDPHVAVALVAGDGGAVTWPAFTSLLHAKRYLLTGDRIPAGDAAAIGLANFVVPPEAVLGDAVAFAHRLAQLPPQAVQETKMVLNQHLRQAAVGVLGYGLAAESQSHDTEEYREVARRAQADG